MDEKFLGYETLSSHDYGKYYLRIYDTYNEKTNPINFGDKVVISIANVKDDPGHPYNYKDELVKILQLGNKGKHMIGAFLNITENTPKYRSGQIELHFENIKKKMTSEEMKKIKIYYDYLKDPSFGTYYLINYKNPRVMGKNIESGTKLLISYTRANPNDLKSYRDVWVEVMKMGPQGITATFVNTNKYESGTITLNKDNIKDIQ